MRVLFTSTPGWGHVNPMLPLARAFADRGDEVLWATPPAAVGRLEAAGFAVRPAGLDAPDSFAAILARSPHIAALPAAERPDHVFPILFGAGRAEPMLRDLQPVVDAWSPALVVHEAGEFAGAIAASARGIPHVTHGFGALTPEVRVARAGEDVARLWSAAGLEPRPYGGSYDHLYLDIYPPSLKSQERPHVPRTLHLQPVGAAAAAEQELPPLVTEESDRPLVYVTFGTVFNDVEPLRAVVEGARAADVRLLVTVGPDADPSALGAQPTHVHVERYVPQDQVLERCSAVVSHAGSGTFLAAAAAGLPQLCLPQGADQFLNAAACTRSGAGLSLPSPATAEQVRTALERLLAEPAFTAAAQRLAQDVAAMPTAQEAADRLAHDFA
jgi:UDP:flavonoid glycosyltransferase YjiC (YdhE family)